MSFSKQKEFPEKSAQKKIICTRQGRVILLLCAFTFTACYITGRTRQVLSQGDVKDNVLSQIDLKEHDRDEIQQNTTDINNVRTFPADNAIRNNRSILQTEGILPQTAAHSYHRQLLTCTFPRVHTEGRYMSILNKTKQIFTQATKSLFLKQRTCLSHYKNPCWEEVLDGSPIYDKDSSGHMYRGYFRGCFAKAQDVWRKRFREGVRKRVRCVPYAYLAGMPKCGTTDLYTSLLLHENITAGCVKEPEWWAWKALGYNETEPVSFSDYLDLYDLPSTVFSEKSSVTSHHKVTLDGSPSTLWEYARWPLYPGNEDYMEPVITPPQLIYNLTPSAKIIIILRNPTDRLYSHYYHQENDIEHPANPEDFNVRVKQAITRWRHCTYSRSERECAYDVCLFNTTGGTPVSQKITLVAGLYYIYIADWMRVFPGDQLKIITLEDYRQNKTNVVTDVIHFLEIGDVCDRMRDKLNRSIIQNEGKKSGTRLPMLESTRYMLHEFYSPYNKKLSVLLGETQFEWDVR